MSRVGFFRWRIVKRERRKKKKRRHNANALPNATTLRRTRHNDMPAYLERAARQPAKNAHALSLFRLDLLRRLPGIRCMPRCLPAARSIAHASRACALPPPFATCARTARTRVLTPRARLYASPGAAHWRGRGACDKAWLRACAVSLQLKQRWWRSHLLSGGGAAFLPSKHLLE